MPDGRSQRLTAPLCLQVITCHASAVTPATATIIPRISPAIATVLLRRRPDPMTGWAWDFFEAHLMIVFASLAVSRWIEADRLGRQEIRQDWPPLSHHGGPSRPAGRHRRRPSPVDLRQTLDAIDHPGQLAHEDGPTQDSGHRAPAGQPHLGGPGRGVLVRDAGGHADPRGARKRP